MKCNQHMINIYSLHYKKFILIYVKCMLLPPSYGGAPVRLPATGLLDPQYVITHHYVQFDLAYPVDVTGVSVQVAMATINKRNIVILVLYSRRRFYVVRIILVKSNAIYIYYAGTVKPRNCGHSRVWTILSVIFNCL